MIDHASLLVILNCTEAADKYSIMNCVVGMVLELRLKHGRSYYAFCLTKAVVDMFIGEPFVKDKNFHRFDQLSRKHRNYPYYSYFDNSIPVEVYFSFVSMNYVNYQ